MSKRKPIKIIGYVGDCHPIEYGGGIILDHGDNRPTMRYFEPWNDSDNSPIEVYDIALDQRKRVIGDGGKVYVVPIEYCDKWIYALERYGEWYDDRLPDVASFTGKTREELIDMVCSDDPIERALFYETLASYVGWHNLADGERWTRPELKKLYALRFYVTRKRKVAPVKIYT